MSLNRRSLLRSVTGTAIAATAASTVVAQAELSHAARRLSGDRAAYSVDMRRSRDRRLPTPDEALARLVDGNTRFALGSARHPDQDAARRDEIALAQHPFATILSCVDSRVPPEIIFDQGLGDLFTVRTAGAVLDKSVWGSLAYGVEKLHTPLLLVLGHQRCGAVTAAVEAMALRDTSVLPEEPTATGSDSPPSHLKPILDEIQPVVAQEGCVSSECVDTVIRSHARRVAAELGTDPSFASATRDGALRIVPAYYSLDTGLVEYL